MTSPRGEDLTRCSSSPWYPWSPASCTPWAPGIRGWIFLGSVGLVPSFHQGSGSKQGNTLFRAMVPAVLAIGMVPCPGAVIIMLFTMHMGIVHIGVLIALVFTLGISITLSTVGLVMVSAGNLLFRRLRTEEAAGLFHAWTGLLGGILLVIVG